MVIDSIWQEFLKIVKEEVGSRIVDTWLKAVSLTKWDHLNKTMYVQAPNSFVKEWISANYNNLFKVHLGRLLNVNQMNIVFTDQTSNSVEIINLETQPIKSKKLIVSASNKIPILKNNNLKNAGYINPKYKFNTFVIGPNNSLAYSAAFAIAQKPGLLYNPLFIYGCSGLGKTHLLHAIGNQILLDHKKAVILYQTADRFVTEFINAIRFDKIHLFKDKYKSVDVLLIDDIQFISNKEQTQEAFFHIFNSLYDAHKQIVFTSDTYPKEIQGMAERLRSRLEWGLITDIYVPTLETKIAILKKKLETNNNQIFCEDVLYFIATKVESNIRELEGSLIRVLAFANLTNQQVTLDIAKKVLGEQNEINIKKNKATFIEIAKLISKNYACSLTDLQSKNKNKDITMARQVAMYLMKNKTDKSLQEIAIFLKRRNHSTIVHAINKVQKLRNSDPVFNNKIKAIEQNITNL